MLAGTVHTVLRHVASEYCFMLSRKSDSVFSCYYLSYPQLLCDGHGVTITPCDAIGPYSA